MNHGRLSIEGETGTPVSRLEFAVSLLNQCKPASRYGYNAYWLFSALLLFNSAPVEFLMDLQEPSYSFEVDKMHNVLVQRFMKPNDPEFFHQNAPWPIPSRLKLNEHIGLRLVHYHKVYWHYIMMKRDESELPRHGSFFITDHNNPGEEWGRPISEKEIWEFLRKALDSLRRRYPISHARYAPHLANFPDFNRFLRWTSRPSGREFRDDLGDERAFRILESSDQSFEQSALLKWELDEWLKFAKTCANTRVQRERSNRGNSDK